MNAEMPIVTHSEERILLRFHNIHSRGRNSRPQLMAELGSNPHLASLQEKGLLRQGSEDGAAKKAGTADLMFLTKLGRQFIYELKHPVDLTGMKLRASLSNPMRDATDLLGESLLNLKDRDLTTAQWSDVHTRITSLSQYLFALGRKHGSLRYEGVT